MEMEKEMVSSQQDDTLNNHHHWVCTFIRMSQWSSSLRAGKKMEGLMVGPQSKKHSGFWTHSFTPHQLSISPNILFLFSPTIVSETVPGIRNSRHKRSRDSLVKLFLFTKVEEHIRTYQNPFIFSLSRKET